MLSWDRTIGHEKGRNQSQPLIVPAVPAFEEHGLFQLTGRSVRVPHEVEIPHRRDSPRHIGGMQQ